MRSRFQFSLKWLFVAMLVVAAFFTGASWQKRTMTADGWAEGVVIHDLSAPATQE